MVMWTSGDALRRARAWRRTKGFLAVGKYRMRKGLQESSLVMGWSEENTGFTGKPVLMILSLGIPHVCMDSRVV